MRHPPCRATTRAHELLAAVTYAGYRRGGHFVAFYACMYAMMRPGEVIALRRQDCELPEQGWGRLMPGESRPTVGRGWTDSGQVHEARSGLRTMNEGYRRGRGWQLRQPRSRQLQAEGLTSTRRTW